MVFSPLLTMNNLFMHFLHLDLTIVIVFLLGYQQALLNTYNTKVPSSLYHSELILSLVLYLYLHATPIIYFSNLLNKNIPARSLRKSDGNLLVPKHS